MGYACVVLLPALLLESVPNQTAIARATVLVEVMNKSITAVAAGVGLGVYRK